MAAINKNFVIKNGLEVDTNLILADSQTNKVGIGTTVPQYTLHVNGGIGATDLYVSGIGTIVTLQSTAGIITNLTATNLFAGVGTITRIQSTNINNSGVTTSITLNITGIATIAVGVVTFLSGTNLNYSGIGTIVSLNSTNANVSGISTLGITSATNLTSQQLNVSGISTVGVLTATNLTSQQLNVSGITTLGVTSATNLTSQQLNVSGISTVGVLTATRIGIGTTNPTSELVIVGNVFVSGISTLGTVKISSGIITATSGIVTYFGDGNFLNLTSNPSTGIGIGTISGVVGYAVTFINFKGSGVSTAQYNSSTGIATIFFEGGGGGGSISISTTAPLLPGSGDLWYSPDYGRTFIYYDESVVGYGTDAFWVDAAPFNVGIITSLTNVSFSPGSAVSPSMFFVGDNQTGFFSPGSGQFTVVSSGSSVLNVNASGINITGIATITNASGTVKIGIGTTALLVEGNARVTGILTVGSSSITLNGTTNIINVGSGVTINSSGINVTGIISATSFSGSGANLTGISSVSFATTSFGLSGSPNITVGNVTGSAATFSNDLNVGTAITMYSSTGIISATKYYGDGSGLSGIDATRIVSGLSSVTVASSSTISAYVNGSNIFNVTGTGVTMTSGKRLDVSSYSENVNFLGSVSGSTALDVGTYTVFVADISGTTSVTFTLSGTVSGRLSSATLILRFSGSGSRNISLAFNPKYVGGAGPTYSATAVTDIISFFTADAGTTTFISVVGQGFA